MRPLIAPSVHHYFFAGGLDTGAIILDELCAPVIALDRYVELLDDTMILQQCEIKELLESILQKLQLHRHPTISLYSTFLQPTDDMHNYPYLTYDNVLVWKVLRILSHWFDRPELSTQAENVKAAILQNHVVSYHGKSVFAWSVDLEGHWDIYDEPPGSLQLLPFYGFCDFSDPIWTATISLIRDCSYELSFADHKIAEIGCKHAAHPWILSICNSLLSGHMPSAIVHLKNTVMDNGIACESVDEDTGDCTSGAAFATCAGFLSFSLLTSTSV